MISCRSDNPGKMIAEFAGSRELDNYPSGSTISHFENQLYLMGDDASSLIILDTGFNIQQQISFFPGDLERIKKTEKADIESSEWIIGKGKPRLWLFGSGSLSPQRDSAFCFDPQTKNIERIDLDNLYSQFRRTEIRELNIEAATRINNHLFFGSRGNLSHPQNYLIQIPADNFAEAAGLKIIPLNLPEGAGISGMSYLAEQDILLITSSIEHTSNAFDDGEIGESNLGVIYRISEKLNGGALQPDEWVRLSGIHSDFKDQKIESICTLQETDQNETTAVLVSDDDQGGTRLFRLKLRWSETKVP